MCSHYFACSIETVEKDIGETRAKTTEPDPLSNTYPKANTKIRVLKIIFVPNLNPLIIIKKKATVVISTANAENNLIKTSLLTKTVTALKNSWSISERIACVNWLSPNTSGVESSIFWVTLEASSAIDGFVVVAGLTGTVTGFIGAGAVLASYGFPKY